MKTIIQSACVVLFSLMAVSAAQADSWERKHRFNGPYGGSAAFNGKGYCNDYVCESRQKWTAPSGNSVTRKGRTKCYDGYCESTATWSGPRGKIWSRKFRLQRN